MQITFTDYALQPIRFYRLWIIDGAQYPVARDLSFDQHRLGLGVFRAFRSIPENGDRILRVVYVPEGNVARIVTAFFDRNRLK